MNLAAIVEMFKAVQASPRKTAIDKLVAKKEKEWGIANSPVYIRDIVVRPSVNTPGESQAESCDDAPLPRLKEHIRILFNLANEDHRATYGQPRDANSITRLSTPEFSFYTKQPLTMDEFIQLYQDIGSKFELHSNVHVLLSSFAVKDERDVIFNMSVFIEGGHPVTTHVFAKNSTSFSDADYGNKEDLFTQQRIVTPDNCSSIGPTAEFIASPMGALVNTASVFEVVTMGGARYTQMVDVCIDHALGHSARQMEEKILGAVADTDFIPDQVEQCITSSSINPNEASIVSDRLLHVDAEYSMPDISGLTYDYRVELSDKNLSIEAQRDIFPSGSKTTMIKRNERYTMESPPFGPDCQIEYFKPRLAGHFLLPIRTDVEVHNQEVMKAILLAQFPYEAENIRQIEINVSLQPGKVKAIIEQNVNHLEDELHALCDSKEGRSLHKDLDHKLKIIANRIIRDHMTALRSSIKEKEDASVLELEAWKQGLSTDLGRAFPSENQQVFLNRIKATIERHLEINLSRDLSLFFEKKETIAEPKKRHFFDQKTPSQGELSFFEHAVDMEESPRSEVVPKDFSPKTGKC